jgi:hypothetical protein
VHACGIYSTANFTRLFFSILILRSQWTGNFTLTVAVAGVNVTRLSIAIPVLNTGIVSIVGLAGTAVSPANITSGFYDQGSSAYIPITMDVPCSVFGDYRNTNLALTHEPCRNVFQVDSFAANTCLLETCGGQNITCPGRGTLKPVRACTPGHDCM